MSTHRVALVHDWLTGMRGGEKVLERIAARFPGAPIHTLVWKRGAVSAAIESHPIVTSFLQHLPDAERRYRWMLPFYPRAIAGFDLSAYDVVISTSHAVAKAAPVRPDAFHLSYVFTPMRYVWEQEDEYFGHFPWPLSAYVRRTCARLRAWDVATSVRPDVVIADSTHVAARIRRNWGRDAQVIHPPVDVAARAPGGAARDGYLVAGAFAPYKRADHALTACRALGRPLTIAGSGQDERRLRALAGPDVRFTGWVSDAELTRLLQTSRALLFPGEEDFGILPVEAMACGCPVIALARGGALETVGRGGAPDALARARAGGVERVPGGILYGTPGPRGLAAAIEAFERERFDPAALREHALPFAPERFDRELDEALNAGLAAWRAREAGSPGASTPPSDEAILAELVALAHGEVRDLLQFGSLAAAYQYRTLYRTWRRHVPCGAVVLDWGAGNGHFSYFLSRAGYRATGFSFEPFTFERWLPDPGYRFVRCGGDPVALPFPDAAFDAVASVGVLEHVRETGGDEAASLAEIARVLRPGGTFVAYHFPNRWSWIDLAARLMPGKHRHRWRYSRADVRRLVEGAGLGLIETRRYGVLPRTSTGRMPAFARGARAAEVWDALDAALGVPLGAIAQNHLLVARKPAPAA